MRYYAIIQIILLTLMIIIVHMTQAQNTGSMPYKTAIGLRAGGTEGLTIKQRLSSGNAFEGIISFWPYAMGVTGLYEIYRPTSAPGLHWYYGGGGHLIASGSRNYYYKDREYYDHYRTYSGIHPGIDGILGLEYKVPRIPFAFSIDVKPTLELIGDGRVGGFLDPGLGLKVAF